MRVEVGSGGRGRSVCEGGGWGVRAERTGGALGWRVRGGGSAGIGDGGDKCDEGGGVLGGGEHGGVGGIGGGGNGRG